MHNDEISFKPVAFDWLDELANPDFAKTAPDLIGRIEGPGIDQESVRSGTTLLTSASVAFNGAAIGVATVSVFESKDSGDDAGLVFRCTILNAASAYQPHAVLIADGVDLHIAGEDEATAMLSALQEATTQALRTRRAPGRTSDVGGVNEKITPASRPRPGKH